MMRNGVTRTRRTEAVVRLGQSGWFNSHGSCVRALRTIKPVHLGVMNMTGISSDSDSLGAAWARVAALRVSLQAMQTGPVRLVETHISWVLLTDRHAFKLKKPLRLPFVDFSTLAARRHFCEEELRLNRRLAPSLYLNVVEVRDSDSGPSFGGDGTVLDVAVKMRRFDDGALWSDRLAAGGLAPSAVDQLAQRLAGFHRDVAVASVQSGFGSPAVHERVTGRLIDAIDDWHAGHAAAATTAHDWPALRAWLLEQLLALTPLFEVRRHDGHVRECHGDLHLANLLQLGDEATAFDGIEFDPELRWIDVLNDIAFVAMDLMAHGERGLAFRFVDAYLEATGDYDGLPALRFYLAGRALVRAQVAAVVETQGGHAPSGCGTADYLAVAMRLARETDARLAITHGLPGSGKSFVSQGLLEAAGALRVRSDVERKRLFGLGASQSSQGRVAAGIYDSASTSRTYARLLEVARIALVAGWPAIVDAAFLRAAERASFAALAAELCVPFAMLDCRAASLLLRLRLEQRKAGGGDASEADVAVLERLCAVAEPLTEAERVLAVAIDAGQPLSAVALAGHWRALALPGSAKAAAPPA
jgi:aminoglycoside phosphotransferase family enzyme/predicted kinase